MAKSHKMKPSETVTWDLNTLSLAGLGKGEVIDYDAKNKKAVIKVINSPIAKKLKFKGKEPVDMAIAGYIGGSATVIFNSEKMHCKEVKCEAIGHPHCIFEVYEGKNPYGNEVKTKNKGESK